MSAYLSNSSAAMCIYYATFSGTHDPEDYLTWELKVDKVFRMHNYSEAKKIHMAAVEFDDYALIWWEQVINQREAHNERPVASWVEFSESLL